MIYNADLNEGFFNSLQYLNKYYGITRDPSTENFIIIMKYYRLGSLKDYITKNFHNINNQNIIHRDFHSGNILYENEIDIAISDLGISKSSTKSIDNDNEVYGVISYMALEILRRKEYTIASDIYSFGMIMWELITGRMPFWDQNNDP